MKKLLILIIFIEIIFSSCIIKQKIQPRISNEEISITEVKFTPFDIFLLLDQSASMSGEPGIVATDPGGLRAEAAKYFVNNLSTKSDKNNLNRIGIINFGTIASEKDMIKLTPVYIDDQKTIDNIIKTIKPMNLGETNFISALKLAYNEFIKNETFTSNRNSVIIIFTDGEPYDSRKLTLEKYFNEISDFINKNFKNYNTKIYLIGIDKRGDVWDKIYPYWKKILNETQIYKINNMDELKEIFNEIIRQLFQIPSIPPDIVGEKEKNFKVPPYIDTLEIHCFFDTKNVNIEIKDPEGKIVKFDGNNIKIDKGTYILYIINNPTPGEWSYKLIGGTGKVLIYKNFIPAKIELIQPTEIYPLDKETKIMVQFTKKNGEEIVSDPKYPLRFVVSITDNKGEKVFSDLLNKYYGNIYITNNYFIPKNEGTYTLNFEVAGGSEYSYSYKKDIVVKSIPYIYIKSPKPDSNIPLSNFIKLIVQIKLNEKIINPRDLFETDSLVLLRAQIKNYPILKDSNIKIEPITVWFDPNLNDPTIFTCYLPIKKPQEGRYEIIIALKGKIKNQSFYSDVSILNLNMKRNILQITLLYSIYILLLLFVLWVLQWLIYIVTLRKKRLPMMQIRIFKKEKDQLGGSREILIYQKSLGGKKYLLIKLSKKQYKDLNGYILISQRGTLIYFSYFKNLLKYILTPLLIRKNLLVRNSEVILYNNYYLKLI